MASRIDEKGVIWALCFGLVLLALLDILGAESVILDYFTGGSGPSEGRLQRAIGRALNNRRR